jgi:hypothetical protein
MIENGRGHKDPVNGNSTLPTEQPFGWGYSLRSPHLGLCWGLLVQHRPDRLVAHPKRSGEVSKSAVASFGADGCLLRGGEFALPRRLVRSPLRSARDAKRRAHSYQECTNRKNALNGPIPVASARS